MNIRQISWRTLDLNGGVIDSVMMSSDGVTFGALCNGRPHLLQGDVPLELPYPLGERSGSSAALSPDGQFLALADEEQILIGNLSTGEVCRAESGAVHHLAWRPDGQELTASHPGNRLSRWTARADKVNSVVLPARKFSWLPEYANDNQRLFVVSTDKPRNQLYVVPEAGLPVRVSTFPETWWISSLAAWRSGVMVGMHDHSGRLWAYEFNSDAPTLDHSGFTAITALSIPAGLSADEEWLAIGTNTGEVVILNAGSLRVIERRPPLWSAPVRSIATSPQGFVVAGADDGQLALIELEI